ncbi:MAG: hypothetical protein ACLP29_17435 [Dissulfurispiraceae bacterium]
MSTITDTMYYPKLNESVQAGLGNKSDPDTAAKQVEQVFLSELLKNMLENTDFGKDKMVSAYMPYITSEIAKNLTERGIGVHDFLMRSQSFRDMVSERNTSTDIDNEVSVEGEDNGELKMPGGRRISHSYGQVME